jgi:hypothetical protein
LKKGSDTSKNFLLKFFIKKFFRGSRDTCGAAKKNAHGGDTSPVASYVVIALQMPPHAVGFFKKAPLVAEGTINQNLS